MDELDFDIVIVYRRLRLGLTCNILMITITFILNLQSTSAKEPSNLEVRYLNGLA